MMRRKRKTIKILGCLLFGLSRMAGKKCKNPLQALHLLRSTNPKENKHLSIMKSKISKEAVKAAGARYGERGATQGEGERN